MRVVVAHDAVKDANNASRIMICPNCKDSDNAVHNAWEEEEDKAGTAARQEATVVVTKEAAKEVRVKTHVNVNSNLGNCAGISVFRFSVTKEKRS